MTLIAIGGAEDKMNDMVVLRRVLAEAKTETPRILVITTASKEPEVARAKYENAFANLHFTCEVSHVATRVQANAPALLDQIAQADIIFFAGGDQRRLTAILGGTVMMDAIKDRYEAEEDGLVVAGTSAGAAAASSLMICGGDPDQAMTKGHIPMTAGLGFVGDVVFDTHFGERGRLTRLFNAVTTNPGVLGIGLDEDTAVIVKRDGSFDVVGKGNVTIVDGRNITFSNIAEVATGDRFDVDGIQVSKLAAGDRFQLPGRKRQP